MSSYIDQLKSKYSKEKEINDSNKYLSIDKSTNSLDSKENKNNSLIDNFKLKSINSIDENEISNLDKRSISDTEKENDLPKEDSFNLNIDNKISSNTEDNTKFNKEDSLNKLQTKKIFAENNSKEQDALEKLKALEHEKIDQKEKESSVFEVQEEKIDGAKLLAKYGTTKIYKLDSQSLLHYSIPVPKPNPSQKIIINTLKEATTRLISSDPYKIRDPLQRKNIYYQKVIDILENAQEINIPKHLYSFYANAVVREMTGYGMIEPLLEDDKLEEIMIVGPKKPVYVYHVDYGMMTTNIIFFSDEGINDIIDKIARSIGRNVDISNPLLDARLPDGSRVNATVPPASIDGSTVTIRKFRDDPYTIVDLINFRTLNLEVAAFLWCAVEGFGAKPSNILISGGTGSGKTTTLNVLANFIPEADRILTIEDTAELKLPVKHVIRFEGRPPGLEGKGELSLEILTKNTLRMRPDRIVVGEIRHTEASTLFTAMNTGHDGCMGTVHANSAKETIVRITSPPMSVPPLMLAGIDFIIIQKRLRTSKGNVRRITAIAEIKDVLEGDPKINLIFKWNPETDALERTTEPILYFDLIKTYTSFSNEDIKKKIEQRAEILKILIDKKIRSVEDVSKEIQKEYIIDR
jgi:archaeal flagellar protein FlaI